MSMPLAIEPVRTAVTVAGDSEHAWNVFTRGFASWWPVATHSVAASEDGVPERLVLEPREGGEIYELVGGVKRHWARIHTWKPPNTLGYTWHVNPDNPPTEVVVTFTPVENGTRVEVVHSGWEAYGANRDELRTSYGSEGGWQRVLAAFAATAA
jgi:uncharacterized protein YndB with AHSA1/START domain